MGSGNLAPGPALILFSGVPGSGKTFLAARIAKRADVTVVESDAIRRSIVARPSYHREESARVFAIAEQRIDEALRKGNVALLDATNLTQRDRRRFLRCARSHDATIVAVRLTAPDVALRERLSRPRDGYSQADVAVYERMRERARPFTIPVVVVDSRFDPGPSIDLILSLLSQD